jgi:ABC-type spermidine/putrescine transport system permease subunit II
MRVWPYGGICRQEVAVSSRVFVPGLAMGASLQVSLQQLPYSKWLVVVVVVVVVVVDVVVVVVVAISLQQIAGSLPSSRNTYSTCSP